MKQGFTVKMFSIFCLLNILTFSTLFANPPLREFLSTIQLELSNLESEVRILDEKSKNQGLAIESLRERLIESDANQKSLLKGNSDSMAGRVSDVETFVTYTEKDLKSLQSHANETTKTLSQYKKKIEELETLLKDQNKHIASIQDAIGSVMTALNIPQKNSSETVYNVKNGDTLEKIARRYKTSIKKIKTLNNLKNDRIYIGQKLKLP